MTAEQILETPDLIAAGVAGDEVRRRLHGAATTFVRVFEMHVEAPLSSLPAGLKAGEIRIIGAPPSIDAAVAAVRAAVALSGPVPVTGFSVSDLAALGPLGAIANALREAGLAAVAHLPIDLVEDAPAAARVLQDAGLPVNTITIHALEDDRRIELCERAAAVQAATGAIRAFAPLPRTMSIAKPTTGYDDVKMVSLARIVAEGIPSIQVDWQLYRPKMAQVALTVGADDVDSIAAIDPGILGTRRSPLEEIKGNIRSAALEPVERDGLFRRA